MNPSPHIAIRPSRNRQYHPPLYAPSNIQSTLEPDNEAASAGVSEQARYKAAEGADEGFST